MRKGRARAGSKRERLPLIPPKTTNLNPLEARGRPALHVQNFIDPLCVENSEWLNFLNYSKRRSTQSRSQTPTMQLKRLPPFVPLHPLPNPLLLSTPTA